MSKSFVHFVTKWTENKSQLLLLQEAYAVFGGLAFVLAGVIGLFNQALGFGLLIVPIVVFSALGLNIIAWALIRLGVEASAVKAAKEIAEEAKLKKPVRRNSPRKTASAAAKKSRRK